MALPKPTQVNYAKSSPYYGAGFSGSFLDLMQKRKITKLSTDKLYSIDRIYHLRPDLLAFDLYQKSALWWVFAARNPNALKDPLFDFVTNNVIYLPDRASLITDLGL
jgi:hypothetical protein